MRKMKESGIEWIGDIPEGWKNIKISYGVNRIGSGTTPTSDKDELYNGVIPWITTSELKESVIYSSDKYISEKTLIKFPALRLYPAGSLIIAMYGATIGRMGFLGVAGTVNQACCVLSGEKLLLLKYIFYFIFCFKDVMCKFSLGAGQPNLSQEFIRSLKISAPPLSEQQRIADYLDTRCARIDEAVELVRQSMEKLRAYKLSLITEAVTKGLDPDVPMKDSGIPWIGEIPKGWIVTKILRALAMPITDGPHETPELFDSGIPFISAEAIKNERIDFTLMRGYISNEFYNYCCKKYTPQINDIYLVKSGATTGKVAIVENDDKFQIWSPLAVLRTNSKNYFRFIFYVLRSYFFKYQMENNWTYGTQQNIGMRTLERLLLPLPPLAEQQRIADYLDAKCARIDALLEEKERLLERLAEYKKSLIFECVTGKREVSA